MKRDTDVTGSHPAFVGGNMKHGLLYFCTVQHRVQYGNTVSPALEVPFIYVYGYIDARYSSHAFFSFPDQP